MIIVDPALEAREAAGNPARVVMIGAGFVARSVANQIANALPGMRLCEAPEGRLCDACAGSRTGTSSGSA